jgi:N-acetyl-anhydromuramyl-L-alanine amidase AmpD
MKPTLRKGDTGSYVIECQQLLNEHGAQLYTDGIFGSGTEQAVMIFQNAKGLTADGIVGQQTWTALESGETTQGFHECVDEYIGLNPGQYMSEVVSKIGICIHHTVSDGDPGRVVNLWNADSRGPVGTHFIIGRTMDNGDDKHDGKIVQCMDLINSWAYHIATTRMGFSSTHNRGVNKKYVGIELCSWGCLDYEGGKFYTKTSPRKEVAPNEVEVLETPWRTFKYWHKYTHKQMMALRTLIMALNGHAGINLDNRKYDPPVNREWFDLSWDALSMRRKLTIHSSFEYGKFDAYPAELLVGLLRSISPA